MRIRHLLFVLASMFLATLTVSPAHAQATRTWVSGVGDDANPCSRTAPCKTLAGAISKTATGGEINVLDSAGIGAVTINKSITIDGAGTQASILAVGTNGIIVNGAGAVVNLRNLSINGAGSTAGNGIRILNAAAVNIENVNIMNFGTSSATTGRGVSIETSTANVRVNISNSTFYNNSNHGIHAIPTAGNLILDVDNVHIARGGAAGIDIRFATAATISNCSITNHAAGAGVVLELSVTANISNCIIANNQTGVTNNNAAGNPTARLYASTITGNTTGIQITGGQIITAGNNMIRGNTTDGTPSSNANTQ